MWPSKSNFNSVAGPGNRFGRSSQDIAALDNPVATSTPALDSVIAVKKPEDICGASGEYNENDAYAYLMDKGQSDADEINNPIGKSSMGNKYYKGPEHMSAYSENDLMMVAQGLNAPTTFVQ